MGKFEYLGHTVSVERTANDTIISLSIDSGDAYRIILQNIEDTDDVVVRLDLYDNYDEGLIIPFKEILDALDTVSRW